MQARHYLFISSLLLAVAGGLLFVYEFPEVYWITVLGLSCAIFCGQMLDIALTWKGTRLSLLPILLGIISISYWFWIYVGQNETQVVLWNIGTLIYPAAGISLFVSLTDAHRNKIRTSLLTSLILLGSFQSIILLDQSMRWGYMKGYRMEWVLLLYFLNLIAVDLFGKWKAEGLKSQQEVVVAGLWYTAFEFIITYVID